MEVNIGTEKRTRLWVMRAFVGSWHGVRPSLRAGRAHPQPLAEAGRAIRRVIVAAGRRQISVGLGWAVGARRRVAAQGVKCGLPAVGRGGGGGRPASAVRRARSASSRCGSTRQSVSGRESYSQSNIQAQGTHQGAAAPPAPRAAPPRCNAPPSSRAPPSTPQAAPPLDANRRNTCPEHHRRSKTHPLQG